MPSACSFTADQRAEARRLYDAGGSLAAIAKFLDVSPVTLKKYREQWQWPVRFGAKPKRQAKTDVTPKAEPSNEDAAKPANTRTLIQRVESAVRHELGGIEERLGGKADPAEAERNARVLASLVKSLTELTKLDALNNQNTGGAGSEGRGNEQNGSFADEYDTDLPPRDLAALREELAARIGRLRRNRSVEGSS